ncbi:MAG: hypothetical protein NTX25_12650 [Proteobacteria bacterium]|nr:hypothetical protein [Pseudomonadota bacterium]
MRLKSLILALLVSSSAFAESNSFELVTVPHSDIDSYMRIGNSANGTPEKLQGLWWMDGNPLPDEVVSFAGAKWQKSYENGQLVGYETYIAVYQQGIWSWHDSFLGRTLYKLALDTKLTYHFKFNLDFSHSVVTPILTPTADSAELEIPQSMLLDFTMNMVNKNEYSRDSILFGQPASYRFRRIVDAEGRRLSTFNEFLSKLEVPNALLPYCESNQVGDCDH